MNTIVDGLKNNLVYHDIKITMGDIVEALQTQDVSMQASKPFIDIESSEPTDPLILNQELNRQGFGNISVTVQSKEYTTVRARKLKIEGREQSCRI